MYADLDYFNYTYIKSPWMSHAPVVQTVLRHSLENMHAIRLNLLPGIHSKRLSVIRPIVAWMTCLQYRWALCRLAGNCIFVPRFFWDNRYESCHKSTRFHALSAYNTWCICNAYKWYLLDIPNDNSALCTSCRRTKNNWTILLQFRSWAHNFIPKKLQLTLILKQTFSIFHGDLSDARQCVQVKWW